MVGASLPLPAQQHEPWKFRIDDRVSSRVKMLTTALGSTLLHLARRHLVRQTAVLGLVERLLTLPN